MYVIGVMLFMCGITTAPVNDEGIGHLASRH